MKRENFTQLVRTSQKMAVLIMATLFIFGSLVVQAKNPSSTRGGTVFYVSTTGSDSNDGLTWATAFATIQKGIDEAASFATEAEVWVAEGTYYPTDYLTDSEGQESTDVYKSIIMYSGVDVYGGFEGTETTTEIGVTGGRQLSGIDSYSFAHPTVISGESTASFHCVWFATNGFQAFSYMGVDDIMIPIPLEDTTRMDGFTITNGFANLDIRLENTAASKNQFVHLAGGGVSLIGSGELKNCIIENNTARYGGGGVAMFNGALMKNCLIRDNFAVGANFYSEGIFGFGAFDYWRADGAGVVAMGFDYQCVIEDCKITNNTGAANDNYPGVPTASTNKTNNGGGIYLSESIIRNSLISGNNIAVNPSPYDNGASASCGGGMYVYATGIVDNCEITDNGFTTGSQNGAGVYMADYSSLASSYDDLIIRNSFIHSNRAGGAVAVDSKYSTLLNNIVANNNGTGIYGYGNCKNMRTINCLVYNNSSIGWGHSTSTNNQQNQLINSTIVRNGSGVSIGNTNNHVIYNSIIWGNGSNPATISNATVSYSAFSFTPPAGTGNILLSTDNSGPGFTNPTASTALNLAGWETADFNIQEYSNCVDVGNPSLLPAGYDFDLAGNDRIIGCDIDMGAYESIAGGTNLNFYLNGSEYGANTNIQTCINSHFQISLGEVYFGSFPFTASWTVNGSDTHPLAGNNVVISAIDQILLDFDATEDLNIQFTSIVDNTSCPANADLYYVIIDVMQPEPTITINDIDITSTPEIIVCEGTTVDFRIEDIASVLYPPMTVSWTINDDDTHVLAGTDVEVTGPDFELFNEIIEPGVYNIEFTIFADGFGCSADLTELSVTLIVKNTPNVLLQVNENALYTDYSEEFCYGTPINITMSEMQEGAFPIFASWIVNGNATHEYSQQSVEITSNGSNFFTATPLAGTYVFEFTSIIDYFGCPVADLSIYNAEIIINEAPELNVTIAGQALSETLTTIYCNDENLEMLFVDALGGVYPYTVSWTINGTTTHPAAGNSVSITTSNQLLFSQMFSEGNYDIEFTEIIDANNCNVTDLASYQANVLVVTCADIESELSSSISVYPNPTSSMLNVVIPSNYQINNARIVNIIGETIMDINLSNTSQIDVESLPAGSYMIVIETENNMHHIKFVKN